MFIAKLVMVVVGRRVVNKVRIIRNLRHEEYWDILRQAGQQVIFMANGCLDAFVDDIMACGARGLVTEPFTDFKAAARRHENCVLAGEGDTRILMRNHPAEIRAMVLSMVETARIMGGYQMSIGNHIPNNVPVEAVKTCLDLCD
ncbi:MAG: uroporphyrinogen decarboxylase family protein, partial [Terrimicrobiaceae bacterium]|nr:uroporphyrinogen decarboxylase family protein [Terrimicrobiaceae bacterium]